MKKDIVTITYKKKVFKIAYFFQQGSNRETIVYIHGLGCRKEDFIHIARDKRLKSFSHIGIDLPGSGETPYPKKVVLDFYDISEIIALVLRKLKIQKVILVGHSSGGIPTLLYATKHPNQVKKFINIEGTLWPEQTWYSDEIKKPNFDFSQFQAKIFPRMFEEIKTAAESYIGFQKYLKSLKYISPKSFFHYRVSHAKVSNEISLMDLYLDLPMPTLFMSGSHHKLFKPILKELREKGAQVAVTPKSHHFSFHDNLDQFTAQIKKFLSQKS